jgi:DNA-binding MarR family transcriptional regulator
VIGRFRREAVWQDAVMNHASRSIPAASAVPRISYAIARLQQLVLAAVSERVAPHGLTALQFTTLSVLGRYGAPLSSSQLARRSFMTPQSMHEVIRKLERDGLIERTPHPSHRRKLPASLTGKGRRVVGACERAVAGFEARMLRGLSDADRDTFLRMITAAVRSLGGGFDDVEAAQEKSQAVQPPVRSAAPARKARPR